MHVLRKPGGSIIAICDPEVPAAFCSSLCAAIKENICQVGGLLEVCC